MRNLIKSLITLTFPQKWLTALSAAKSPHPVTEPSSSATLFQLPEEYHRYVVPQEKNWNFSKTTTYKKFIGQSVQCYLPYILDAFQKQNSFDEGVKFLDFGCGWGPMSISFKLLSDSTDVRVSYTGIDIMPDSVEFLSSVFNKDENFNFYLNEVEKTVSYVDAHADDLITVSASDGLEGDFSGFVKDKINLQWSSSVFTHLTSSAAKAALTSIAKVSAPNAVHINTWLIIDPMSEVSLFLGQTDRKLPYDCGDYLTSSESNPLACTAFKLDRIKEYYDDAGLEIVSIERGSWRTGIRDTSNTYSYYKNAANHYQDIIISRVKKL